MIIIATRAHKYGTLVQSIIVYTQSLIYCCCCTQRISLPTPQQFLWTIFALVLVRVSENEISFWQLSLIELQYSCGTTVISVQSQRWTRHRSIERIDTRTKLSRNRKKIQKRSIPSPFQVQTNSKSLPFFSSVSAQNMISMFSFSELWKCAVSVVSAYWNVKNHWISHKMNNRKFFFERYLIFNYLSNFST